MKKIRSRKLGYVLLSVALLVVCASPHATDPPLAARARVTVTWSNAPVGAAHLYVTGLQVSSDLVNWREVARLPYSNGVVVVVLTNRPAVEFYRAFNGLAL